VHGTDVTQNMSASFSQKAGNPPASARGAWTSRGIKDWNHAINLLKVAQ